MEKKTYYISLHTSLGTSEIRDVENDADFDFEIEATPEEAHRLLDLFEKGNNVDFLSYAHAHIPLPEISDNNPEQDNENYDRALGEIYRKIYQLGTPETKRHIEDMGVLDVL